jgi:hypothetical protein
MKTDLSPAEKLIAAYAVDIMGLTQQQVAVVLNVSNVARVNEACMEVREAVGLALRERKFEPRRAELPELGALHKALS